MNASVAATITELWAVINAVRDLHDENPATDTCRECGYDYPCPTLRTVTP